jgi:predicted RNA-binding Zn-ribbon protein involved in translation (DUF1610 family)
MAQEGTPMADFPRSLCEFQKWFPDDAACAAYLAAKRWLDSFRCPHCGGEKSWQLPSRRYLMCTKCRKETSVTVGTIMHRSHLPLTIWFWAAYLMATIPFRTKDDPHAGGQGCSHEGKLLVAGAVEIRAGKKGKAVLGRARLCAIPDYCASTLHAFMKASIAAGATAKTDGFASYAGVLHVSHEPHVIGKMAAHIVLPGIHRLFSNLKTWGLGVYHGLRRKHLQAYLDEFAFHFNRRKSRHAAFDTLAWHRCTPRTRQLQYVENSGTNGISISPYLEATQCQSFLDGFWTTTRPDNENKGTLPHE